MSNLDLPSIGLKLLILVLSLQALVKRGFFVFLVSPL